MSKEFLKPKKKGKKKGKKTGVLLSGRQAEECVKLLLMFDADHPSSATSSTVDASNHVEFNILSSQQRNMLIENKQID